MERLFYICFLLALTGTMVAGQSPCNSNSPVCRNGGTCQTIPVAPLYICNCQDGFGGYNCTEGSPRDDTSIQAAIFLPLLAVGALKQFKILEIPGIPLILDILQDMVTEFTPCAVSCLVDGNIFTEIYNGIQYLNGTYTTCIMDSVSQIIQLNLTTNAAISDLFNDKTFLCPLIDATYTCMANELERSCGTGLKTIFERIYQKTDLLDCSPQQQNDPLNIYTCGVEPFINSVGQPSVLFEDIRTCLNSSVHFQRLNPMDSWSTVFNEEETTGFPTLCGLAEDAVTCTIDNLRMYRQGSPDCVKFDRMVYANRDSILESVNCFNNGTAIIRCLGDPDFLEPLLESGQSGQGGADKRRKRAITSSPLGQCLDTWVAEASNSIDADLDALVQAGNVQAVVELFTKETCVDMESVVKCTVDNAFPGKPYCNFIGEGLSSVLAPILKAYFYLGECQGLSLNTDQNYAVNNCSCLTGFPTKPLGTCEMTDITQDIIQDIVFTLVIRMPWNDSIANKPCSEVGYLKIICQELELILGNDLNVDVNFLGTAPNDDDEIELLYEAKVPTSQRQIVESSLETLVMPQRVQSVAVSTDVKVKQVDSRELIISNLQPVNGVKAGGTPITITGYFLENLASVTIGGIDCQSKIRSPVVYICITGPLLDGSKVNQPLGVKSGAVDLDLQFSYTPDPIITNVKPLKSIFDGGASLTVTGAYFDSVVVRLMMTTITSLDTGKSYTTPTECSIRSETQLICPTAPIVLNRLLRKRKRREAVSVNRQENLEVRISFQLDGVEAYRNLTGTALEEFSEITYYANPVIEPFRPALLTFTSSWPVQEKFIEIKGKNLLIALEKQEYIVMIGEGICDNVIVQSNIIICEPPKTRPKVAAEDDVGYNRIPVKLFYASQVGDLGHLSYVQNLWEYPPGRYGIIGSLCVVILLIVIIAACCIYKKRTSKPEISQSGDYPTAQQHLNLAQKVKRWSRKSPKRFSSFIPTGTRAQTNYAPSSYDGDHPGKHQPYWDNY